MEEIGKKWMVWAKVECVSVSVCDWKWNASKALFGHICWLICESFGLCCCVCYRCQLLLTVGIFACSALFRLCNARSPSPTPSPTPSLSESQWQWCVTFSPVTSTWDATSTACGCQAKTDGVTVTANRKWTNGRNQFSFAIDDCSCLFFPL